MFATSAIYSRFANRTALCASKGATKLASHHTSRARGVLPVALIWSSPCIEIAPHKWAVGTTFEWEFDFLMKVNPLYAPKQEPESKTKKTGLAKTKRKPARRSPKHATDAAKPITSNTP